MTQKADGAASETTPLMSFAEAVAICGPELIAKLEAHAATAPPFTDEQKRILAAAFAARPPTLDRPAAEAPHIPAQRQPSEGAVPRGAHRPERNSA